MILYFSPEFVSILNNLGCEISHILLSYNLTNHPICKEINCLNISNEKPGYISFIKGSKVNMHNYNFLLDENRSYIKIGRLVKKLGIECTAFQIEEFTNKFKSLIKSEEEIKIVTGEEIRYWYNSYNYLEQGELGKSCMRYEDCQPFLDIYVNNPETCHMIIIKKNGKLVSRALLWKIHKIKNINLKYSKIEYVVDRIYSVSKEYDHKIENLAIKNNWGICKKNKMLSWNDNSYYASIEVKVKPKEYYYYPYMDTFSRYNPTKGILYNDCNDDYLGHILRKTTGSYRKTISKAEYFKRKLLFLFI